MTAEIGPAEPWTVREIGLPEGTAALRQGESVFALANGHIGLRGNLDEPDLVGLPGTYLNSLYEVRDLTYPEAGYAFPERTETIIDAPNGKTITATVDGEPFDLRTGTLRSHERVLDLRRGTLTREVEWTSPGGVDVRLRSERLVSFARPSIAVIRYTISADADLRVTSELRVNEDQPDASDDPRSSAVIQRPFRAVSHDDDALVHCTRRSGLSVAVAVAHLGPDGTVDAEPDRISWATAGRGEVTFEKILAYRWNGDGSRDEAIADRDAAARAGFAVLADEQRAYLDDFWHTADIELDGDPEIQQAVRFGLFHVLQAGAQAGPHPIAAKGLTGNGYDGHTLWDTEAFVLPVLTYTLPGCVGHALRWRHATLGAARERAAELGLAGAAFPWRTIGGPECSGYWPAGTAALHVNADIADAVRRYHAATGDDEFMREAGHEIVEATADLWADVAYLDTDGGAHIAGVTGPDEYSALMDDNLFTNLMAARNLRLAGRDELADRLVMPYDEKCEVHQQAFGFTRLEEWDFEKDDDYPLMLAHPYLNLYRKQVVKQADLVLAMMLAGDAFTDEEKKRNFDYYEARTVRDSSLSAPVQAVLAAEIGYLSRAYEYLAEAALLDLRAGGESGGDGLHIAASAGAWIALVMGFGGMRDHEGELTLSPRLPASLPGLRFSLRWRGGILRADVTPERVIYRAEDREVTFKHCGRELTLPAGESVTFELSPAEDLEPPYTPRPPAARKIAEAA